jgi:hypothetical protein
MNALPNETPARDINAVLRAHDQELLKLADVVGVYVGLLPDNKTQCLKVMLAKSNPKTEQALPKTLEGHPVRDRSNRRNPADELRRAAPVLGSSCGWDR